MAEYHKIQTVYLRDPATQMRTLLEGQWALPEFEYLARNEWQFTEKIDGTNIRIIWDGTSVRFGGRTDDAQTPTFLLQRLQDLFPSEKFRTVFPDWSQAILYGEGFGAKIQKGGGNYIKDGCDFILFDVQILGQGGDIWLERPNVEDVASKAGLRVVPLVGRGTLLDAIEKVRGGFESMFGAFPAEGLVMRPAIELTNRRGQRIISKVKHKDFVR